MKTRAILRWDFSFGFVYLRRAFLALRVYWLQPVRRKPMMVIALDQLQGCFRSQGARSKVIKRRKKLSFRQITRSAKDHNGARVGRLRYRRCIHNQAVYPRNFDGATKLIGQSFRRMRLRPNRGFSLGLAPQRHFSQIFARLFHAALTIATPQKLSQRFTLG
jgi:hypothetical protein